MELWQDFYPLLSKSCQLIRFDLSGLILSTDGELFTNLSGQVFDTQGLPLQLLSLLDSETSPSFHCPLLDCRLWEKQGVYSLYIWAKAGEFWALIQKVEEYSQLKPLTWKQLLPDHSPEVEASPFAPYEASDTVLLAEDNPFNQKIISRMIEKAGYRCFIASNGKELLNLIKQHPCFLILMDLNMPELDGYQTLDAIREQLPDPLNTLPVVALTASPIDVEGAGFDSLLKKPVDTSILNSLLNRYHSGEVETGKDAAIDLTYLREVSGGNAQTLVSLINIYLTEVPQAIADMEAQASNKEWRPLKELAHKTKANFRYVGAEQLYTLAHRIEAATSAGSQVEQIPGFIAELKKQNPQVVIELKNFLKSSEF